MDRDAGSVSRKMHFAIAVATITPEVDFRHAVDMAKLGLLYADRVTLFSVDAAIYRAVQREGSRPVFELLNSHRKLWPRYVPDPADQRALFNGVAKYKYLRTKKRLSQDERRFMSGMEHILSDGPVKASVDEVLSKPGGPELQQVVDVDFVSVHEFRSKLTLGVVFDTALRDAAIDDMVKEYIESTVAYIESGSSYPLLDDLSAQAIQDIFRDTPPSLSGSDMWRSQYAALAGNMLERLPLFEEASVDKILDIRRALDTPLRRFRTGVAKFTDQIKGEPWGKDFRIEAERLFLKDVEPTILELEEIIRQNNPLQMIAKRAAAAAAVAGTSVTLHGVVSSLHQFPNLVSASLLGAPIGKAAKSAYDVYEEWRRQSREIERNQLYFWVEAKRRLA